MPRHLPQHLYYQQLQAIKRYEKTLTKIQAIVAKQIYL